MTFAASALSSLDDLCLLLLGQVFFVSFVCCCVRLLNRNGLELGPDGIQQIRNGRMGLIGWQEVGNFRVVAFANRQIIVFDLVDRETLNPILQELADEPADGPGSLGCGYEISAAKVVDLLNGARRRWVFVS